MRSNTLILALLATTVLTGGCFFRQKPAPAAPFQIAAVDLRCLETVPTRLSSFFSGALQNDDEIRGMVDCASRALENFRTLTRGQTPGVFKGTELQTFLNRNLPEKYRVPDELLREAMLLKAGLFGGNGEEITGDEILRVRELLKVVADQSVAVKRLMPYSMARAASLGLGELRMLLQVAENSAAALGAYFDGHGASYPLSNLGGFLDALERYYTQAEGTGDGFASTLVWVRELVPVIGAGKVALVGGSPERVVAGEWTSLLRTIIQIQDIYFYSLHFIAEQGENKLDWLSEWGLDAIEQVFGYGVDVAVRIRAQLAGGTIPATAIRELFARLEEQKGNPFLHSQGDAGAMTNVAAFVLLGKAALLGGDENGDLMGVNLSQVEKLKSFYAVAKTPFLWAYREFIQRDPVTATPGEIDRIVSQAPGQFQAFADAVLHVKNNLGSVDDLSELEKLARELDSAFSDPKVSKNLAQSFAFAVPLKRIFSGGARDALLHPSQWQAVLKNAAVLVRAYFLGRRIDIAGPVGEDPSVTRIRRGFELASEVARALPEAIVGGLTLEDTVAAVSAVPEALDISGEAFATAVRSFFAIKQSLLGGGPGVLGVPELSRLSKITAALKLSVERMKVYSELDFTKLAEIYEATFDALASDAELSLAELSEAMGDMRGLADFSQADASSLITSIQKAFPKAVDAKILKQIQNLIPLVFSYKGFAVGGGTDVLRGEEWQPFLVNGGKLAMLGARLAHFMSRLGDWDRGTSLDRLVDIEAGLIPQLRISIITRDRTSQVPFTDFDALIDGAYTYLTAQNKKVGLRASTLKNFLRPAIQRIAGGFRNGASGRQATGLTLPAVEYLADSFDRWLIGQRLLIRAYTTLGNKDSLRTDVLDALHKAAAEPRFLAGDARDAYYTLAQIMALFRPLFFKRDSAMSFLYDGKQEFYYSFDNVSRLFFYDGLARLLVEGWANDVVRAKNHFGLSLEEFQVFVVDTYDMIKDLDLSDGTKTAEKLAKQRFLETNVFTSQSNGDLYFGRYEAVELMAMIATTVVLSNDMYDDMSLHCTHLGVDLANKPKLDMSCFRQRISDPAIFTTYFGRHVPVMAWQYSQYSATKRARFIRNLEMGARGFLNDKPIDSFEAQSFAQLPLYIESVMKRYDVNRRGYLKLGEAMKSYPVLCRTLKQLSPFTDDCASSEWTDVESLLGYLLLKGAPPQTAGKSICEQIIAALDWIGWGAQWSVIRSWHLNEPEYDVDRERLMSIVAGLAGSSSTL